MVSPGQRHSETAKRPIPTSDMFTHEEINYFHAKLIAKKQELLEATRSALGSGKLNLDSNEIKDEVDLATQSIEHSLTFKLLDRNRQLLYDIECALERIYNGEFGYCEGTGNEIARKRLELTPWVRYSVEYKQFLEQVQAGTQRRGINDE